MRVGRGGWGDADVSHVEEDFRGGVKFGYR